MCMYRYVCMFMCVFVLVQECLCEGVHTHICMYEETSQPCVLFLRNTLFIF